MDMAQAIREIRNAIKAKDSAGAVSLLKMNPNYLNVVTPFGTWLHVAASLGDVDVVKYLVSQGVDLNVRSGVFDAAAIKEAASDGHIEIVRFLLSHGAEMDVSDPERNPLFGAIYGGHLDIVKLLVESGIDVHVKYTGSSMKDMDALAFARERGQLEIANYLANLGSELCDLELIRK